MSERPTPQYSKRSLRDRIAADTERFIARGGLVRQMSHGATGDLAARYNADMQKRRAKKAARQAGRA